LGCPASADAVQRGISWLIASRGGDQEPPDLWAQAGSPFPLCRAMRTAGDPGPGGLGCTGEGEALGIQSPIIPRAPDGRFHVGTGSLGFPAGSLEARCRRCAAPGGMTRSAAPSPGEGLCSATRGVKYRRAKTFGALAFCCSTGVGAVFDRSDVSAGETGGTKTR
jgi:hypothetical protein